MAIRKRKDPPSNWFSEDPIVGAGATVCESMSGKRFKNILSALRVCDLEKQPQLHLVGTLMVNRIPKPIRLTKKEGNRIERGAAKENTFIWIDETGEKHELGVVSWMDCKPIHAFSTCFDTSSFGICDRRTKDGTVQLPRPEIISQYNPYMGGIDSADQRGLHSETRVHGLHRWWVRLFFYGFDVAMGNAFILFKQGLPDGHKDEKMTMRQFRIALVKRWLGNEGIPMTANAAQTSIHRRSVSLDQSVVAERQHVPISCGSRQRCVVCALWHKQNPIHSKGGNKREPYKTSFKCEACNVPVCASSSDRPCFKMLHGDPRIRAMYCAAAEHRQRKTNKSSKI